MNGLIVYCTAYGTTKQYAEWISKEIEAEIRDYKKVTDEELQAADYLIIGSFVTAHKLIITKWLLKKEAILKDKKLYFYSVSGAKPGAKELDTIFSVSIPENLLKNAETFQFGGKMRFEDLTWFHKLMMRIGTLIEKDPEAKADMKKDMQVAKNNVDQKYIKPLVDSIKKQK